MMQLLIARKTKVQPATCGYEQAPAFSCRRRKSLSVANTACCRCSWQFLLLLLLSLHEFYVSMILADPVPPLRTRNEALEELRLKRSFTQQELRAAYRQRSLETHPDKAGGSNDAFVRVSEAYKVLSEPSTSEQSSSSSSAFHDDMSEAERLRMAEEMFFDAFGDLFDEDKVGAAIDAFFATFKPTIWIRLLKPCLKWALPKMVGLMEGDNTVVSLNGVRLTGKEFKELRKQHRQRATEKAEISRKEDL